MKAKKLVQGGLVLLLFITAVAPVCARVTVTHTGDTFFDGPYMQTKGTASLLVIPVDFPDEPSMTGATSQLNEIFLEAEVQPLPLWRTTIAGPPMES